MVEAVDAPAFSAADAEFPASVFAAFAKSAAKRIAKAAVEPPNLRTWLRAIGSCCCCCDRCCDCCSCCWYVEALKPLPRKNWLGATIPEVGVGGGGERGKMGDDGR